MTLTCIVCPMGCRIMVEAGEARGHACPRGMDWALQEAANPLRTVTSTVALMGGELELLPVRTEFPVPKAKVAACIDHINRLRVRAPVKIGQVICADLGGTGVKLTAARSMQIFPS